MTLFPRDMIPFNYCRNVPQHIFSTKEEFFYAYNTRREKTENSPLSIEFFSKGTSWHEEQANGFCFFAPEPVGSEGYSNASAFLKDV
jgi:hypothetical protein